MLELKVKAGRRMVPIFDLPTALGRREAAREIADQIDALIAFMDDLDGDSDFEATNAEDDFALHIPFETRKPGCVLSDGDGDVSWPEWHTRGRHKQGVDGGEAGRAMPGRYFLTEDDEDDDPDTGVEDGLFDADEDRCEAGDDMVMAGPVLRRGDWLDGRDALLGLDCGKRMIGSEDDAEYSAHGADDI